MMARGYQRFEFRKRTGDTWCWLMFGATGLYVANSAQTYTTWQGAKKSVAREFATLTATYVNPETGSESFL